MNMPAFAHYTQARSVVDYLVDHDFGVKTTQIVDTELRMVEQVTGRPTWSRALLSAVGCGAWFGIFVGLLLSILTNATLLRTLTWGVSWGVVFLGVFAVVGYASTRGGRDFTSRSATVPTRAEVLVESAHSEGALGVLVGTVE